MTSREAMFQQLKNLKGKPLKEKVIHIATYFWAPIAAVLFTVFVIVSLIVTNVTRKDPALTFYCLNSAANQEAMQEYLDDFAVSQGVDLDEFEVSVLANGNVYGTGEAVSYANAEAFAAMVTAGELDLTTASIPLLLQLGYNENFWDLSQLLTPEQLENNKDNLLYIDMAFVEMIKEMSIMEDIPPYPDPKRPEDMERPIPFALLLPEDAEFTKRSYPHMEAGIAMVVTASHEDMALAFLDQFLK